MMSYMNKKNDAPDFSDNPAYQALDPKAREVVDYFCKHYDDPITVMRNMLAYIEGHEIGNLRFN